MGQGQRVRQGLNRQRLTDHSGGKRQHLSQVTARYVGHRSTGCPGSVHASLPGPRIGITGIDDPVTGAAPILLQVSSRKLHWCRAKCVLGKQAQASATRSQLNQDKVIMIRFFDPRLRDSQTNTGDWLDHQLRAPWHCLYFLPLPQGQGSLRPTLGASRTTVWGLAGAASPSAAASSTPAARACSKAIC